MNGRVDYECPNYCLNDEYIHKLEKENFALDDELKETKEELRQITSQLRECQEEWRKSEAELEEKTAEADDWYRLVREADSKVLELGLSLQATTSEIIHWRKGWKK